MRNEAYDNVRIYKEKTKKWHDQNILRREFKARDQVLLFNSKLKLFLGKLRSKWNGPYTVVASTTFGAVTLKTNAREEFKVNGQTLKTNAREQDWGTILLTDCMDVSDKIN